MALHLERLKFSAAYWVPCAGVEATGGKPFSAEEIHNWDLILITLLEGWYLTIRALITPWRDGN